MSENKSKTVAEVADEIEAAVALLLDEHPHDLIEAAAAAIEAERHGAEAVAAKAAAEAKAKARKAELSQLADKLQRSIPVRATADSPLIFRWGIVTAAEDEIIREAQVRYSDEAAKLQQASEARAAEISDPRRLLDDWAYVGIGQRLGKATIQLHRLQAAVAIKGFRGDVRDHNEDLAGAVTGKEWPAIDVADPWAAIGRRCEILMLLDRRQERELREIIRAHLDVARGLDETEKGN